MGIRYKVLGRFSLQPVQESKVEAHQLIRVVTVNTNIETHLTKMQT